MPKVKNTIPVYDICSVGGSNQINGEIIAQPFAEYLKGHPNLHTAHRHTFYHVVLFTKGGGYHTIDFERFDVKAGQIYFMSPGQVHSWSFKGEVDGYIINFAESILHGFLLNNQYAEQFAFFRSIAAESVFNLPKDVFADAKLLVVKVVEEAQREQAYAKDIVAALLVQLFATVQRSVAPTPASTVAQHNQVILHNFRKLVDTYYAEKRLPKEYAALLYITPNHLNALCKDLLGKPAGEVIRDRILLEVKRLLINADISMGEIAEKLDFSDSSHLTKFFKKYTNTTPDEFRKSFTGHH